MFYLYHSKSSNGCTFIPHVCNYDLVDDVVTARAYKQQTTSSVKSQQSNLNKTSVRDQSIICVCLERNCSFVFKGIMVVCLLM